MGRRGCCRPLCLVASDGWPASGTDLTPNWDERVGDWSASGGDLVSPALDGALVIHNTETESEEMSVQVTSNRGAGTVVGAVANYLDDNNYFYAEIEDSGANTIVRLYRRAGGGDTLLLSDTIAQVPTPGGLTICLSESSFSVLTGDSVVFDCDPDLHDGGLRGGIRNGSSTAATYTAFTLENWTGSDANVAYEPTPGMACCLQQCHCVDGQRRYCIPRTLLLTFTASGGCDTLDGATIELEYIPEQGYWRSLVNTDASMPACMQSMDPFYWTFECKPGPCDVTGASYVLRTSTDAECLFNEDNQCLWWEHELFVSSCDPVIMAPAVGMTYGGEPGFPAAECGGCCDEEDPTGYYTLTLTEAP